MDHMPRAQKNHAKNGLCTTSMCKQTDTAGTAEMGEGGWGAIAKIYKVLRLKAKVINILKRCKQKM